MTNRISAAVARSVRKVDDIVIIDVAGGRCLTLDQFGYRLWTALGDRPTLAALLVGLREDAGSAEQLAEDVTRLLARWRAIGVISWV
ncbi:MAG: PqqD family protein [Gemmatimonadaceae bacterium]